MLSWIVKMTIISIVLVILMHHLINFFKSTLTVPKIKDLVNRPMQKYENMYNIINNKNDNFESINKNFNDTTSDNEYTLIDLLPVKQENNMKDELKNFLKSQLKNSESNLPSLNFNDTADTLAYSSY
jgi:hypothetical protein